MSGTLLLPLSPLLPLLTAPAGFPPPLGKVGNGEEWLPCFITVVAAGDNDEDDAELFFPARACLVEILGRGIA